MGLQEIYFYYQYRQDTYVPPNYTPLRLEETTIVDHELEDFRGTATVLVKPAQLKNASLPIEVTVFGISMLVKPMHSKNAPSPIEVTPSGMEKCVALSKATYLTKHSLSFE